MYLPAHFSWTDVDSMAAFCRSHDFATLISDDRSEGGTGLEAQHLPLLVDRPGGQLVLSGHVAVGNRLWRARRALAVFSGPHAYISAATYDEPDTVPTWNYLAVHASGPLTLIADPEQIRQRFAALGSRDPRQARWQERLSEAAYDRLVAGIRWFRIDVERLEGKAKLSQNHALGRKQRVIAQLASDPQPPAQAIARAMQRAVDGQTPWDAADQPA
jgi:transcriptional regulator